MLPLGFSFEAERDFVSCKESLWSLMNSLHYLHQSLWVHLQTQHKTHTQKYHTLIYVNANE